ncbi:MAG TPA: SAM-dependent methyltransferase [Kiritimatiellia bacterium]|nr:SAM-dependent methyltransferase [Kiritimatiellia bacterium]
MATPAHTNSAVRDALAVGLVSGCGIAYQITLMRIFSIVHWHHFAYLMISVAMLGFGASGTLLTLLRPWMAGRERQVLVGSMAGFAGAMPLAVLAGFAIPFETFHLVSDPRHIAYLFGLSLVLALPFLLCATAIATALIMHRERFGWLYGINMTGSACGAVAVIALLFLLPPAAIPIVLAVPALIATALAGGMAGRRLALSLGIAMVVLAAWATPRNLPVSEYKILSYLQQFPDFAEVARTQSPLSMIQAVTSSLLRETPGQLSNYPFREKGPLPPQAGLVMDAGSLSAVHQYDGDLARFAFMDYVTAALPYRLLDRPEVLVIGAGGGTDVLIALVGGARQITAVEIDPRVRPLLDGPLRHYSGGLFDRDDVDYRVAEGRGFLAASPRAYDLIQVALIDAFTAAAAGVFALSESYLYTREAVELYLRRLTPDGVLAITRWIKTPARDEIKLFATLVEALERTGIQEPGHHLAFIRSWNTATLLASRSPWTPEQIEAIRSFSRDRWFDISFLPGLAEHETNRYIALEEETYFLAAREIIHGDRDAFYRSYPFHVRPATDDKPHFFQFFRWRSLPVLVETLGWSWLPFMEWGYVTLLAAMVQGVVASAILILLPLALSRHRREGAGTRSGVFIYFGCLGLAFMFLEIAMIQKFMLFLAYPMYAVAVVLASFLLFAGLGSLAADRFLRPGPKVAGGAVAGLGTLAILYLLLLPPLFTSAATAWSDPAKVGLSVLLLAPLAFLMGMPFPSGMTWLGHHRPPLLPWAWAINGFTSVLGASLATFTAIHLGFRVLVLFAIALYLLAAISFFRMAGNDETIHPKFIALRKASIHRAG